MGGQPMTTTIEVAMSGRLAGLSNGPNAKTVAAQVERDVAEVAEGVGLVGDIEVKVTSAQARDGQRPLRVLVNGTPAPFPPDVLVQLWMERSDYWDGTTDVNHSIAHDCIEEQCGERECAPDDIAKVVVSIVRDSPALLVDDEQAARFGATSGHSASDPAVPRTVLASLLELGVTPKPAAVLEALASNENRVEDSVEAAFALLQGRQIEVRISPSYRSTLTDADGELVTESAAGDAKRSFALAEERLVVEWAIVPPDIVWHTVDAMDGPTIVVRVNDRLSPAFSGLAAGERAVQADVPPEIVERAILNPAQTITNDPEFRLSVVDSSRIDELGTAVHALTPAVFAAHVVYRELISNAFRLVGTEQTLYLLQDLEARAPELVHLVLRHFTVAEITQLLRALVREWIPPRLLPVILERLARLVIDPMPPQERAECVRRGLSSYIFHRFLGVGVTFGRTQFDLSPEIEEGLAAGKASDPLYAEHVRDAVWSMLRGTGTPPMRAAVAVRSAPRDVVHRALAPELPDVVVLSGSELNAEDPELTSRKIAAPMAAAAFPPALG
jgi:FHIPEP family